MTSGGRTLFQDLGDEHVSWLLAAANTFLDQRKADRAIVLLELLDLVDPCNVQGQKMLAYALLIQDEKERCRTTLGRLARCRLTKRDRNAVGVLTARLEEHPLVQQPHPSGP